MDNRSWSSGASGTPPTAPVTPSVGYPSSGNPGGGIEATKGGAFWFHQIGEELRAVIAAAGITPDHGDLTQLLQSMQIMSSTHVNNIAALRGMNPSDGRHIYLKCHTVTGIGGGLFRGVTGAAPGTYVDNGGTIVVPTGGNGSAAWIRQFSGPIRVSWFGSVGGDVTVDTEALAAAKNAIVSGGTIVFPENTTPYVISSVDFTGKSANIIGHGATITCTSSTGAIYKTDHGNKLRVVGLTFNGSSTYRAINCQQTPSGTVFDELEVDQCTFNMASGVFGLYCVGTREPKITRNTFTDANGGNGIYFKDCVSPFVDKCIFKGVAYTGRAIYYPGTGNGTDAGLVLRDSEIMGWDKGVEVVGCDWLVIDGCTIDYNNQSIKLGAQDGANISNNYIGSLGETAALWITYDAAGTSPTYSAKIFVENNTFTGHYTGGNTYDCVLVDGINSPDGVVISNNSFSFYTRYGVHFSLVSTRMRISDNVFSQRTGFGVAPIYNTLGATDSGVDIKGNIFHNPTTIAAMNVTTSCRVNENFGCGTEVRGEVVVGTGVSTFNVPHSLAYTPAKSDILLSPTNQEAATRIPYINSVDAANINIGFSTTTTANAGVAYRVIRGPA